MHLEKFIDAHISSSELEVNGKNTKKENAFGKAK